LALISIRKYLPACIALLPLLLCLASPAHGQRVRQDTTRAKRQPVFRFSDRHGDPFSEQANESPLFLKDPPSKKLDVAIDTGMNYTIYEKIGAVDYRPVTTMTFEEFKRFQEQQQLKNYWKSQSKAASGESAIAGKGFVPKIFISPVLDRIFGSSYVELIPRGFVTLDFGGEFQKINNPAIPIRQQRNGGFVFDQQISMSVTGKVGEKLAVTANFDNNNSFDFQNNFKVEYTGYKEDILKKLELGNVSLPLNNTLIQGAQNLFGIKAQMQFGKLTATAIASTQRGKVSSIDIPGGSNGQGRPFEIIGSAYDENRHFFLGHFFRDHYEEWISTPPNITSGVNITRVEVYVLNRNNDTQTLRNVMGLMDLGEGKRIYNASVLSDNSKPSFPNDNNANGLFNKLQGLARNTDGINSLLEQLYSNPLANGTDFEKINGARKLSPTEYTFHQRLGYITLTRRLQNDEALAVAYEYTYNGRVYKVGELSEDYANLKDDEIVFLKLLRPRKIAIRGGVGNRIIPTWDLMMKNIYTLNVTQLTRQDFQLRIIYRDDKTGIDNPQLQEGVRVRNRQLVEIMGLDRLNPVNDPQRDGNFDYVEDLTISSREGLIIFPFLEPFNTALREAFKGETNESFLVSKYVYDTLYRDTRAAAELFTTKNKFFIVGRYNAGSAQEISIPGFGVSQGSVRVFAGGIALQEGLDYTVDYTFGRVTILNGAILNSGKNISVQYEQNDPFAFQTRTLIGSRFDYRLSEDVNLGGTLLYYNERQQLTRNSIGTEPARNLQYGLDINLRKNSRMLTKLVDALPVIQTKEQSSVTLTGEFAQLIPGTSNKTDGDGAGYIDDFENTATPFSLMSPQAWRHAAVPETIDNRFDESGDKSDDVRAGFRRAKIAWYQIDNQIYTDRGRFKPDNITDRDLENHYVRQVPPTEIFPNFQPPQAIFNEQILDIAYYPDERGPYNYRTTNLTADGFLANPERNWGGITTAIRTEVDFDKANIEYVEFWMLDPFLGTKLTNSPNVNIVDGRFNQPNRTGGKMLLHLGSISEDIMRDAKHAFEQGLPADGNLQSGTVKNNWGYVTNQQYLVNAFDNEPSSRANQDVGLDGVSGANEVNTFQSFIDNLSPAAQQNMLNDPSSDNFRFWLGGEFDAANAKMLERYKNFNGPDGNSPIITGADAITPSGTNIPDNEDLNADNTLSESEEYYEYVVDLPANNGLEVGKGYVVDAIKRNVNGDEVTWYLFRIPVRQPSSKFGNITGFKSIRYARMVLTDFREPVVLRMAKFRMVGSKWRRYEGTLLEDGLNETPEPGVEDFTVSTVNVEENSAGDDVKSPYKVPPGLIRDRDNTSAVNRELNEQSVQMCTDELKDADARSIYKYVQMDFFNYGRLKMFLHANSDAQDDELQAFIRLGTDFDQNYYEIAIPLKISNPLLTEPRDVWPLENEIDIDLDALYALKAERDRNQFSLSQSYPLQGPRQVGRHLIRIFGRPDLAGVRTIMIGVRNPQSTDQRSYRVCLWANELRLTDFNRKAGYAVNAATTIKLADFATVSGNLRYNTFGFGTISSKINERSREERTAYDVTANVNVDKLLPGNHGIKIPMLLTYQKTIIKPQYDPANPDLKIDAALESFQTSQEQDEYLDLIRDVEERRGFNFTNVRKTKVKKDAKQHIYDIENFSFSYAYSEASRKSFTIQESTQRMHKGGIVYTFTPKATGLEPFKNSKKLKSPYLKLIKDFNISLLPSNISVRADLDRSFSKIIYRNDGFVSDPNYLKYFTFNRAYNVRWNLSKGLSFDYSAQANAIIDEYDTDPEGGFSYVLDREVTAKEYRDSLVTNLKNLGRMKNFDQTVTVNYTLPLDKIPFTDWLGSEYRYNVNYKWMAGPVNRPDTLGLQGDIPDERDFKNKIQNTREQAVNMKVDLVRLYNKVAFLKKLNTPPPPKPKNPQVKAKPDPADTLPKPSKLLTGIARLLMSVRSINGTYTKTEGTILPGFANTPYLFGSDRGFDSPGWGFVLGDQDPTIRTRAAENGWLTRSPVLTDPFSQILNTTITLRAQIEPTPDFKIQLDARKESTSSYEEIFRFNDTTQVYQSISPSHRGTYRISTIMIRTAFDGTNGELNSDVFDEFEKNLITMRSRFNAITGSEYDTTAQDIVIPAFIAAYTGKDANTMGLSPFPNFPLPNWRVDYNGLNKIKAFSNIFQSITITHAYQSTYSVLGYSNSLEYNDVDQIGLQNPVEKYNNGFYGTARNEQGQLIPVYVISAVSLSEQFSPLIGINMRTKSRLSARVEYKTKRDLALNVPNAQVNESIAKDVSVEIGYTKNNLRLPFRSQGRLLVLKNDVTFRMNLTVSDTRSIQRKIDDISTVTNGNVNFQLRPNISYAVNQKLQVQMYYERTVNEPQVSNAFRRSTSRFGVQVRFSLAQ
jgi:cell surface protein SprA